MSAHPHKPAEDKREDTFKLRQGLRAIIRKRQKRKERKGKEKKGDERKGKQKNKEQSLFSGHHGYLALHSASWRMSTHRERRLILAATSQHRDGL